ncbi:MAG: sugar phosphate isomerase/epimerase [Lachnospiraceae bacterium]|nr:sugar phosphate isomerase/epimerase [Lachnospiraceae bacterium]
MKRNWLIIPEIDKKEAFAELACRYQAAFEYNDFFLPCVYGDTKEVKRRIKEYSSLNRNRSKDTLHGVFLDMASFSDDCFLAEYSQKRMLQSMEIADELGVKGVVFHSGLVRGVTGDIYIGNWLKRPGELFRKLLEKFPRLEIYLENTQEETPEYLLKMKEELADCKRFSFCLDYAHANISKTKPSEWIGAFGENIRHMHINDNDGNSDLHQVPGEGSVDWKKFELETKFLENVSMLIEVNGFERQKKALEYLTEL